MTGPPATLLITGAEVDGRPHMAVRIRGDRVVEVGADVSIDRGENVLDARGGAVIAGLHDHHVHLRATAAARSSVAVGPEAVTGLDGLGVALRKAAADEPSGAWVRAVGYHESVAGPLDRAVLDGIEPDVPIRIQHRSGLLWVLNGSALERLPLDTAPEGVVERDGDGRPTGRLWRGDHWLGEVAHDRGADAPFAAALAEVGAEAATRGIVGFTDADPRRTTHDVATLRRLPQRLHLMGPTDLELETDEHVTLGPVKFVLDDHALPDLPALVEDLRRAHATGRVVAVHCVTRTQLVLLLAALDEAGSQPGDRVEHASVVPEELIAELRRLGLTVVTQPSLVRERGDAYLADVDPDDLPHLYRVRSLLGAGVPVGFSSDMPYTDGDPWEAIGAATDRRAPSGRVVGPDEVVDAATALAAFQGRADAPAVPRRVAQGAAADLCILTAPLDVVLTTPDAGVVRTTIIGGRVVYETT